MTRRANKSPSMRFRSKMSWVRMCLRFARNGTMDRGQAYATCVAKLEDAAAIAQAHPGFVVMDKRRELRNAALKVRAELGTRN